ncbi:hypothetical protein [Bacillus subtilis]|uniref:hypothetical protein n=1 Tax=Bacillus subtilis TaxID=1423 RepID=UPI001BA4BC6F|nr:hypothetical protein [Bacillus subtilis]QUG79100.1 hypothetical protein GSN02_06355 [Bacillus subtilis]
MKPTITKEQVEAVRKYYAGLIDTRRNMPDAQGEVRMSIEINGCKKTLNLLGIKIEGVNA